MHSQGELAALLAEDGVDVTQATLSRDLRAIGVVKQPLPDGGVRYAKVADASGREVHRFETGAHQRFDLRPGGLAATPFIAQGPP